MSDDFSSYSTFGKLTPYLVEFFPWIVLSCVLVIGLIIAWKMYKPFADRRIRQIQPTGMMFGDIDRMRREGLISEAEYQAIRRKVGQRELAAARTPPARALQSVLAAGAADDPEALRSLFTPEEWAQIEARRAAARGKVPEESGHTPSPAAAPPEPAPPGSAGAGELERLLQKGAISREDYERLKQLLR